LHSYGLKISKNEALTEDSLQDFFLYIYEKRENLSDLETIAPYLFTSYKRFIIKVIKKNKKMKTTDFSEEIITDIQFTKEELITNQETKSFKNKNIEILLNKLPKRQKEAIYLKYYCELKTVEIAKIMNINYQSVVNTLHKAIKNLKEDISIFKLFKSL